MFFTFGNRAEEWLYDLVVDRGGAEEMVLDAIGHAPEDEFFPFGEDISRSARTVLAGRLDELLTDLVDEDEDGDPLAVLGIRYLKDIDTLNVAEALMRCCGKWSPDNSIPDAE